ncbi:hypothetical protein CEXT_438271, partial [Caerostris extrusa]
MLDARKNGRSSYPFDVSKDPVRCFQTFHKKEEPFFFFYRYSSHVRFLDATSCVSFQKRKKVVQTVFPFLFATQILSVRSEGGQDIAWIPSRDRVATSFVPPPNSDFVMAEHYCQSWVGHRDHKKWRSLCVRTEQN